MMQSVIVPNMLRINKATRSEALIDARPRNIRDMALLPPPLGTRTDALNIAFIKLSRETRENQS